MTSIAETTFSAVQNIRETKPRTITLADAVEEITGPQHAVTVASVRDHITAGRKDQASKLKRTLPAFMFAGTFARRRSDAIIAHSGLLVLDFDGCGVEHKAALAADPHAALVFVSPSGNGLKLVISIEADAATHSASFDAARTYFRERFKLEADATGRDLARLCYVSHDPAAIFNRTPELLHRPYMTTKDYISKRERGPDSDPYADTPPPPLCGLCNIEGIITATQPTAPGQRHRKLFSLARGLRFDCGLADKPFQELKPIVKAWHEKALPMIGTQSFTESWSDFVHAWPRAKTPLSVSSLSAAWTAAQVEALPLEAAAYDKPEARKLVSLCWQLARHGGTFYLSMHAAADLIGCQAMTIKRYLSMLQADGMITIVKPGNAHTATTYKWEGKKQ